MIIQNLVKKNLIHPPSWLPTNVHYLTIMGSVAYGVSSDSSDNDVYGFAIPPLDQVFPHLAGEIEGFGRQKNRFQQWQEHHCKDKESNKEYDFTVYSIVRYFSLLMENNPNMVDSLFTPVNCVIHSTAIGNKVRENRRIFLHKGCWPKFKGYAWSQAAKLKCKDHDAILERLIQMEDEFNLPRQTSFAEVEKEATRREKSGCRVEAGESNQLKLLSPENFKSYYEEFVNVRQKSKRAEMTKIFKMDCKFAYHIYRLMDEVEQILTLGDLDLQRGREVMKAIRRGQWTEQDILSYFAGKEKDLEKANADSKLPWGPDEEAIKKLLLECLEMHFGSLDKAVTVGNKYEHALQEISEICNKVTANNVNMKPSLLGKLFRKTL